MNKLYFTRVVEKTRGLFTSSPRWREEREGGREGETDRQTEGERGRERGRERDRDRQTHRETDIQTDRETETERQRQTETVRGREGGREREASDMHRCISARAAGCWLTGACWRGCDAMRAINELLES